MEPATPSVVLFRVLGPSPFMSRSEPFIIQRACEPTPPSSTRTVPVRTSAFTGSVNGPTKSAYITKNTCCSPRPTPYIQDTAQQHVPHPYV